MVDSHDCFTTVKDRICQVEGERLRQLVRCDRDSPRRLSATDCAYIIKTLENADLVVVADYGKGVLKGEQGSALRQWIGSNLAGKTIIVNSKFPNNWAGLNLDALICNEKEQMEALVERGGDGTLDASNLIMTSGAKGVFAFCNHYRYDHFPSLAEKVVDVTGAGDAFTAGFGFRYHLDRNIPQAIQVGQYWAARCIAEIGCGAPTHAKR